MPFITSNDIPLCMNIIRILYVKHAYKLEWEFPPFLQFLNCFMDDENKSKTKQGEEFKPYLINF